MQTFLNKFFKVLATIVGIITAIIISVVTFFYLQLPTSFNIFNEEKLVLPSFSQITGSKLVSYNKSSVANLQANASKTINLKLFNIIPIKSTHINVIDEQEITPGGTVFGIKLFTHGVLVIDTNNVETASGFKSPAKLAGIVKGDIIISIDGTLTTTNEQVEKIMTQSNGNILKIVYLRNDKEYQTTIKPVKCTIDGQYKSGIWVRDSSAGIGTITYYNKSTMNFAGLGHGICDIDTGKIMPLESGQVCDVLVSSVQKGKNGLPGELRGSFASDTVHGVLLSNNECGIYGKLYKNPNSFKSVGIKLKQDVKKGPAKIICTIDSKLPKEYDIIIDKIDLNPYTMTKNMTISVTDKELLEKTGGIVQGMSGSPILQDGKLVGAVTHVFVNNPTKGYAILIENMLENESKMRKAS